MTPVDFAAFRAWSQQARADGTLPVWAVDRQARSRESRERLLAAAYRLLDASGDEGLTMAALSQATGLSIGAVYARFPSRSAVVTMLGIALLEDGRVRVERSLDDTRDAWATIGIYLGTIATLLRRNRQVLRVLRNAARDTPMLAEAIRTTNDRIHAAVRDRLAGQLSGSPTRVAAATQIEYALFIGSAAIREGILYDATAAYVIEPDDDRLVHETRRAVCGYLGL